MGDDFEHSARNLKRNLKCNQMRYICNKLFNKKVVSNFAVSQPATAFCLSCEMRNRKRHVSRQSRSGFNETVQIADLLTPVPNRNGRGTLRFVYSVHLLHGTREGILVSWTKKQNFGFFLCVTHYITAGMLIGSGQIRKRRQ